MDEICKCGHSTDEHMYEYDDTVVGPCCRDRCECKHFEHGKLVNHEGKEITEEDIRKMDEDLEREIEGSPTK